MKRVNLSVRACVVAEFFFGGTFNEYMWQPKLLLLVVDRQMYKFF